MDFCYNLSQTLILNKFMLGVSWFGNGWLPVALAAVTGILFFAIGKKRFALAVWFAPLFGNIVKSLLKNWVKRPRPGWVGCQSLVKLPDYSFPSGHTIFYTIYFGLLAWYGFKYLNSWKKYLACGVSIAMIALVGISRVYLGAHWASDVLAGYAIGGIILAGTIYLLNKYPKKNDKA